MSTIVVWVRRTFLAAGLIALGYTTMPPASALALTATEPINTSIPTPTPNSKSSDRLELVWSKEQTIYSRIGTFLNNIDQRITKWQKFIDNAKTKGKDTSSLQTALDNFSSAVQQAEPIYQTTIEIVSAHPGFDNNGNVTDQVQALATVKDLGQKLKEIHKLIADSGKALHDAFMAFRKANPPAPTGTPIPNQSGG